MNSRSRYNNIENKIVILLLLLSACYSGCNGERKDSDNEKFDPTEHPNWKLVNKNCGKSHQDRIIGGKDAELGQFPWIVRLAFSIKYTDEIVMKCGGTIINSLYVISAAHCFKSDDLSFIRAGELNTGSDPDCDDEICAPRFVDYYIDKIIVHPDFNNPRKYANDITLIRVQNEIEFNDFVAPICLEYGSLLEKLYVNEKVTVAGWGIYDVDLPIASKTLQHLSIPVMSNPKCNYKLKSKTRITKTQICAGGIIGEDSCGGDSGGPLMKVEAINKKPQTFLIGIVSFGTKRCAKTTLPGVYTRVSKFLPWILENIEP